MQSQSLAETIASYQANLDTLDVLDELLLLQCFDGPGDDVLMQTSLLFQ